jgi:D-glycero-D-manno-heptose 1,7-bisphosphate phosphatase
MKKAIFLDRDGVLNRLVLNPQTQAWESPHQLSDFAFFPGTLSALFKLQKAGYALFLVSNQPSYAKGKTSLENLQAIEAFFQATMEKVGIDFSAYYYCYHHPQGVVPEYTQVCRCRKPQTYFIERAAADFALQLSRSWLIGDQDTDVACGRAAGVRTILVETPESVLRRGKSQPDFRAEDLSAAVEVILNYV